MLTVIFSSVYAEKISIHGNLKNGTTQGIGKADTIKMIALQGSMVPIAELGSQTGTFRFPAMDLPEGSPVLLQVTYKGINYNKMVPPAPNFQKAEQEITVFDTTEDKTQINTKSLMQAIREKKGIRVFKLFLIENKTNPPRSFTLVDGDFEFFVPTDAKEFFAQIQQPGSKMPIPLSSSEGKRGGKAWNRGILPGTSELQVSYLMTKDIWEEKLLLEGDKYPIFLKPKDMKIQLQSEGELIRLEKDVPEGLTAFSISPPANGSVTLSFEGGKPVPEIRPNQAPEIVNGSLLNDTERSILAVVGFVALFFSLSFVFVYRKKTNE